MPGAEAMGEPDDDRRHPDGDVQRRQREHFARHQVGEQRKHEEPDPGDDEQLVQVVESPVAHAPATRTGRLEQQSVQTVQRLRVERRPERPALESLAYGHTPGDGAVGQETSSYARLTLGPTPGWMPRPVRRAVRRRMRRTSAATTPNRGVFAPAD